MYPGGALMVTDNLLCRGLIEPDGLRNESQVLQAKGKVVAVGFTVFISQKQWPTNCHFKGALPAN